MPKCIQMAVLFFFIKCMLNSMLSPWTGSIDVGRSGSVSRRTPVRAISHGVSCVHHQALGCRRECHIEQRKADLPCKVPVVGASLCSYRERLAKLDPEFIQYCVKAVRLFYHGTSWLLLLLWKNEECGTFCNKNKLWKLHFFV